MLARVAARCREREGSFSVHSLCGRLLTVIMFYCRLLKRRGDPTWIKSHLQVRQGLGLRDGLGCAYTIPSYIMKPDQMMMPRESIVGGNACTMCLYNIPRASLMITLPAVVILVSGAAMTAVTDHSTSWTDGLATVALVCLILGGVWTAGALVFWLVAWWRFRPRSRPHKVRSSAIAEYDNRAVSLEEIPSSQAACHVPYAIETSADFTNPDQNRDIKTDLDQTDACISLPDEVVYSVRL